VLGFIQEGSQGLRAKTKRWERKEGDSAIEWAITMSVLCVRILLWRFCLKKKNSCQRWKKKGQREEKERGRGFLKIPGLAEL